MHTDRNGPDDTRVIHMDGNNDIIIKRTDPYGFWRINFKRGQMPDMLKGVFTSFEAAKQKIDLYINSAKRIVIEK